MLTTQKSVNALTKRVAKYVSVNYAEALAEVSVLAFVVRFMRTNLKFDLTERFISSTVEISASESSRCSSKSAKNGSL